MPTVQLTPAFVNKVTALPGKSRTEWCDKHLPGLYCEARQTSPGQGTYYLRYKDAGGVTRHIKIARTYEISLGEARARAKELKAEISLGADPRREQRKASECPTLEEFVESSLLPYLHARLRSAKDIENRIRYRLYPKWKNTPLNLISRKEIIEYHIQLRNDGLSTTTADHVVKTLRMAINRSIDLGLFEGPNPAAKIPLFNANNQVNNLLDHHQLSRLMRTLETHPNRMPCLVVKWMLASGARLGESLRGTYGQLDLEEKVWHIPRTNSKSKKHRVVPLNSTALEVLEELKEHGPQEGYLFKNKRTGDRLKTIQRAFQSIKKAAGLEDVPWRLHDARHQHASLLIAARVPLVEIRDLLGHVDYKTTLRYSHLTQSSLRKASTSIDGVLSRNGQASSSDG